ncbi:MAG: hypothetical protein K0U39_08290, partial [Alphaproteobacteria bacterium]|nr:hypothetical protein [Alphaproteobacteria bacterium]
MMANWLSISEIIALNVAGLPHSERGLRRWLNQRNIASRPRAGQGGGNEFNMALMPINIRVKLSSPKLVLNDSGGIIKGGIDKAGNPTDMTAEKSIRTPLDTVNTPAVLNKNDINIKNKTLLQTRLDLLDRIEQYATVNNTPYKIAVEEVLNARELVGILPNPSLPTILRWKRWRACNDLQSLSGGNWGNRKDTGKINPDSEVEKILI